jgi:hypothetical protein
VNTVCNLIEHKQAAFVEGVEEFLGVSQPLLRIHLVVPDKMVANRAADRLVGYM